MNVLVVAAHPDDEVLGCGATIARHVKRGDLVHVLILAEGVTSRDVRRSRARRKGELADLTRAARKANRLLGVSSLDMRDFPDNRMDSVDLLEIIKAVEGVVMKLEPQVVYTHHGGDLNVDHRMVSGAVCTACRPVPGQTVRTVLFFEVPSSTDWQPAAAAVPFIPNWFVDVTEFLPAKLAALGAYRSELRPWPHSRSLEAVEHLARSRGGCVGFGAAEAFALGRHIET